VTTDGWLWDYLVLTASNDEQARAYQSQLGLRQRLGLLPGFREVLAVADPEGRRVGSGGSTLYCLQRILNREAETFGAHVRGLEEALSRLRVLIVHAGGDSRRLPAYGPCGKVFVPVPGPTDGPLPTALFDRQLPFFSQLPSGLPGAGQVVVTAGDALIRFEASEARMDYPGLTALTSPTSLEEASRHGVLCPGEGSEARIYLQKPNGRALRDQGAIRGDNTALLDIGVMSLDARCAATLMGAFGMALSPNGTVEWNPASRERVLTKGADLYREICCALGRDATEEHHCRTARGSGSAWSPEELGQLYRDIHAIPLHMVTLSGCGFLHFGTTRQLVTSGLELHESDHGHRPPHELLLLNNRVSGAGCIEGDGSWVEGCRITAPLALAGGNVVVGADISQPLALPRETCLDLVPGWSRDGLPVFFVRLYGLRDTIKDSAAKGGTLCGSPLMEWLSAAGLSPADVWDGDLPEPSRSLWNARVYPTSEGAGALNPWLWMLEPAAATPEQRLALLSADRYSIAEMATLADQDAFHARRMEGRT
jgi:fucokinase